MRKKSLIILKTAILAYPLGWAFMALFDLAKCACEMIAAYLSKVMLDFILGESGTSLTFSIILAIVLSKGFGYVQNVLYGYSPLVHAKISFQVRVKFRKLLIKSIERMPVNAFEKSEYLQQLRKAQNVADDKLCEEIETLIFVIGEMIAIISACAIMLSFSVVPLFVAIAYSFLYYFITKRTGKLRYELDAQCKKLEEQTAYYRSLYSDRKAIPELRVYGLYDTMDTRYYRAEETIRKERRRLELRRNCIEAAAQFLMYALNIWIYYFVITRISGGSATVGDLIYIVGVFRALQEQFVLLLGDIISHSVSFRFLEDFYDVIHMADQQKPEMLPMESACHTLQIRNLDFHYTEDGFSLAGLDLQIPKGECIAILGENGSGKSTLVKLIAGILRQNGGEIYSTYAGLPQKVRCVFQEYYKFALTLKNNIGLGDILHYNDENIIRAKMKEAKSDYLIGKYSRGLDTYLGVSYEQSGVDASEGEWQRIKLTKMIMQPGEIYILDEPSASLDAIAEYNLFKNIRKLTEGRTVLLVSHRIGFAKLADRILYMQDGKITEMGTQEELMELGKEYSKLYHEQVKYYDLTSN